MFGALVPEVVDIIENEPAKKEQLLSRDLEANQKRTSMNRFLGWLCLFLGFFLILYPLTYLVSWIPLFGSLLSYGFIFVIVLFSLLLSVTLTVVTISLAWLYYRPLTAITLLSLVSLGLYFLFKSSAASPAPSNKLL